MVWKAIQNFLSTLPQNPKILIKNEKQACDCDISRRYMIVIIKLKSYDEFQK